jgi:ribosomal protein S27AE
MPDEMVHCPTCGQWSTCVYRCDRQHAGRECGADLADVGPVQPFEYPTDFGRRGDGLVDVRFKRICVECGAERFVATDYRDVGIVIRYSCTECEEPTKHRPTDAAVRYRIVQLGLEDAQPDDHHQDPAVSTPA